MSNRFSKAAMIAKLEFLMSNLEKQYGFYRDMGYSFVAGKSEDINRAFGQYDAYRDLIDDIYDGEIKML